MSIPDAIRTTGLRKSFKKLTVLDGIDPAVRGGTILALLGPNGAGKTTVVRILSTLLRADGGQAIVNGFDVARAPEAVRRSIGLTGQYAAVDHLLTGFENLELIGRLCRRQVDAKRRASELLDLFDLGDAARRIVKTYSGGMRRRLDLAASLVASPPILFLDEPTTGLDPRSRAVLWRIIHQLAEDGTTVLLTTQYLEEADQLANQVAVMDHGKIIAQGTADELKQQVGNERAEFTIGPNSDFEVARSAIAGGAQEVDAERRTIGVAVEGGVRQMKRLLDQLDKAGVDVEGLALHRPTLDDVFLALTGHEAAVAASDKEASQPVASGKNRP